MFLGAGSVMHGMNDDVDMRHYGALRKVMPVTFLTFAMGYLAIIGFPGFSGFWSKDKIIETALTENWLVGLLRAARRRHHRLLHDPADADDVLHREALGEGRAPARVAEGDDRPADRARRAVGARRRDARSATGSSTSSRRSSARPSTHEPPMPALVITLHRRASSSRSASRSPGSSSAGATCPREAPPGRLVRHPGGPRRPLRRRDQRRAGGRPGHARWSPAWSTFDRRGRRRDLHRRRGRGRRHVRQLVRRVQNGFVRSYALSILAGVLLVVLALLAVNLA